MTIHIIGESEIRLDMDTAGFGFEPAGPISPFHLLAASLASCTGLALHSWAHATGVDAGGLTIVVKWDLADERPARVTRMEMELDWPDLDEERAATARRVADTCAIHATLARSAEMTTTFRQG